jgi:hypothetical protein
MDFDTTTKPTGTINQIVIEKLKFEKEAQKQKQQDQLLKSLPTLEKEAIEIVGEEVRVIISKDMVNKLKDVFDSCKEKEMQHVDQVETVELIGAIAEDPYFEKNMELVVRENIDGDKETLEQLLHRCLKSKETQGTVQWY